MDPPSPSLAAPPPPPANRPLKSPPLAFEKTPNDALAPRLPPPPSSSSPNDAASAAELTSPTHSAMGRLSPLPSEAAGLQLVVDQQADAIQKLHEAFAAERQSWSLERERLYQRIGALERLLRSGDHHSPAKSPILSPLSHSNFASPQARAVPNSHLPSIAEEGRRDSLSRRREGAPRSIDIADIAAPHSERTPRAGSVAFAEAPPATIKVDEVPISPPNTARAASPPPFHYRMGAGHTPLHAPRPLTPPPHNSLSIDGIEDTPTRNNTHINTFLSKSNDSDEDTELKGPLNMPELPNRPDETNFTLDMLSKKLEQIEKHPEQGTSKPMVFAQRSPGLASPVDGSRELSPRTRARNTENPLAPRNTLDAMERSVSAHSGRSSSNALSPLSPKSNGGVSGAPLSKQESREAQVQQDFEHGGIKLRKKPSVNFGAPFGQLAGFGAARKQS